MLHGQDPRHDLEPWGKRSYFGTAGAAVNIVDPRTGYRESTIKDLFDIGRIVDVMEHIHFFQRAVVPRDIPDPFEMDFNTCYAAVSSTTKHVGSSWVQPEHVDRIARNAACDRRWREAVARASVREPVELLRRAADEICDRRLPLPRGRGA